MISPLRGTPLKPCPLPPTESLAMNSTASAAQPFAGFAPRPTLASPPRKAPPPAGRAPDPGPLEPLRGQARLPQPMEDAAQALALRIAGTLRQRKASAGRAGIVQGLLQEFALSSQEGVALMCL